MNTIENITVVPCNDSKYVSLQRMHYVQEGVAKQWDIAQVHDSVAALLYHSEHNTFILVKQFRPPVYLKDNNGFTYELCAGITDKHKSLEEIMHEEILEEVGYSVPLEKIERITSFYTSVGFAGGKQTLYFATINESMRVHNGGGVDGEMIETVSLPLNEAKAMMYDESKPKTPGLLFAFMWFFEAHLKRV